jgi:hypothetical protein
MQEIVQGFWRWIVIPAGAAVAGGLCAVAVPHLVSSDGDAATSVLAASHPVIAAGVLLAGLAGAMLVAAAVGRLTNAAVGLFVLGCGLMVPALRSGTIRELALGGGSLTAAAVETLVWALIVGVGAVVVFAAAGPLPDMDPTDDDGRPVRIGSRDGWLGALAGLAVLPVVWVVCQSPMKGQAFMAVVVGAMVAGMMARLVKPHAVPVLLFASPCVFGAVGQIIAAGSLTPPLADDYVTLAIAAWNKPMPLDYGAGALLGVSMGLGWAKTFLHTPEQAAAR